MPTLKEFYAQFHFKSHPFSSFTTENENEMFTQIFTSPSEYETISDNFSQKNSIILTGDRGTGKTALIKDFTLKVDTKKAILVQITDYSKLKIEYEAVDLYKFIINQITVSLFFSLSSETKRIKKLEYEQKLLLSYLLKNFVPAISRGYLREKIKNIQNSKLKLFYKKIEKIVRNILNYSGTVSSILIEDLVAKHFTGIPPLTESVKIKNYFPELPISLEDKFFDQEVSYSLIIRIINLVKSLGYDNIIVVFDRVDEDSRFDNDAELISSYIKNILTDNKILLEDGIQIVFSTWKTAFNFIKHDIRTQKHYCPSLTWTEIDLKRVINTRLSAYSNGQVTDLNSIFDAEVSEKEIQQILYLSNSNPRNLWHIFSTIFKNQYSMNPHSNKIQKEVIKKSLIDFVVDFNYYEYYPKKTNSRSNSMDIYSYIELLLELEDAIFSKKNFKNKAKVAMSTAQNYISNMEKIGLVSLHSNNGDSSKYKIKDPKVIFALENNLKIFRN